MERTKLTDLDWELVKAAIEASNRLFVEKIHDVAGAVRTSSGKVFSGINFDTKEGWASICGEVAAIACMLSAGHRDLDTVVAVWRDPEGRHFLLPPCGRCREVIRDMNPGAWVIVTSRPDHWEVDSIEHPCKVRISDLVPLPWKT